MFWVRHICGAYVTVSDWLTPSQFVLVGCVRISFSGLGKALLGVLVTLFPLVYQ